MKTTDIKTVDINTLTWFDKTFGNTYFAQKITLNYGMNDEITLLNPFRYGYSSFEVFAFDFLRRNGFFESEQHPYWQICENHNIIVRSNVHKNCRKRELIHIAD